MLLFPAHLSTHSSNRFGNPWLAQYARQCLLRQPMSIHSDQTEKMEAKMHAIVPIETVIVRSESATFQVGFEQQQLVYCKRSMQIDAINGDASEKLNYQKMLLVVFVIFHPLYDMVIRTNSTGSAARRFHS